MCLLFPNPFKKEINQLAGKDFRNIQNIIVFFIKKDVMRKLYSQIDIAPILPNIALLLFRIYAGFTMAGAGLNKVPLTDWMTEQVTSMGFPFPVFSAWFASWGEFAFGVLVVIGLSARISSFFLAIIMGFAAFGFQSMAPLFQMHITQHFFWMFVLLMAIGPGKFSLDFILYNKLTLGNSVWRFAGIIALTGLLAYGLIREFTFVDKEIEQAESSTKTVNIAGNFNNWDPSVINMETKDSINYFYNIKFETEQLLEFKFTQNNSWDINLGDEDQQSQGFPVKGRGELDEGGNAKNIRVYIPKAGKYIFAVNIQDFAYSVSVSDSIQVE
jgi:putative oxidoreductase